jgi:hypothetical protein
MGCWNGTCALTNLPIMHGDRAVVIPLAQKSTVIGITCYSNTLCQIAGFAIRGTYDDYGTLEKIDNTAGSKATLKIFRGALGNDIILNLRERDKKEYGEGIKDIETLLKLIERGYVNCKTLCFGVDGQTTMDLQVSFMMMHEEAYDSIIKEIENRGREYDKEITNIEYLKKLLIDSSEEQNKSKDRRFFLPDDCLTRWIMQDTTLLNKFFSRRFFSSLVMIPKNLWNPVIELYLFDYSMNLLRKNLMPQSGGGSQCCEIALPKMLANYILKKEIEFSAKGW